MMYPLIRYLLFFLLLYPQFISSTWAVPISQVMSDHTEIEVDIIPADGKYLLLWFASAPGFHERHRQAAQLLSQHGYESWQIDLADALFMPRGSQSLREISGKYVAELITQAYRKTGKTVILISNSYGSIPVLRGARHWQGQKPDSASLAGAILFSPNLYQTIPSLGQEPKYVPVSYATNIPVMILQSEKNGNRWQLDNLTEALQHGGSKVYRKLLPGVTSLFYDKDDAAATLRTLQQLPQLIASSANVLEKTTTPLIAAIQQLPSPAAISNGIDSQLKPYRGKVSPLAIALNDANGKHFSISDYRGKVTVVNFWATWCSPCIEEIPSLNRLREKMSAHPFQLISVNYAQEAPQVKAFLKKVQVDFPVLIDDDGRETAKWKVIAFPSTFVIGPDGQIRYGVNAAIEWDDPEVIKQLQELVYKK